MFSLSKIIGFLITPLAISMLLCIASLVCLWRKRIVSSVLIGTSSALIVWVSAMPYIAGMLAGHLEQLYTANDAATAPSVDAIVVLGGSVAGARPPTRPTFDMNSAADRVWHTAALYRHGKAPCVVVAAGSPGGASESEGEADAIAQMLIVLGVPTHAISIERSSRNTRENAEFALPLVFAACGGRATREDHRLRILLVTSALHMPRAIATFRKVWSTKNIEVIPAATDVEITDDETATLWQFMPEAIALSRTSRAIKEYVGLIALNLLPAE
jgi:uncharacterized SAM-binding protein YcdF (DUF218 family)